MVLPRIRASAENGLRDTRKLFYLHFLSLLNLFTVLPKVYINTNDFLPEPWCSVKIKAILRKITSTFGLSSGVAQEMSEHVEKK